MNSLPARRLLKVSATAALLATGLLTGCSSDPAGTTAGSEGTGSAFLDPAGNALGTLSTLGLSLPIINNNGDIGHELAYAQAHSGIAGLRLVLGTEPFTPNR